MTHCAVIFKAVAEAPLADAEGTDNLQVFTLYGVCKNTMNLTSLSESSDTKTTYRSGEL